MRHRTVIESNIAANMFPSWVIDATMVTTRRNPLVSLRIGLSVLMLTSRVSLVLADGPDVQSEPPGNRVLQDPILMERPIREEHAHLNHLRAPCCGWPRIHLT